MAQRNPSLSLAYSGARAAIRRAIPRIVGYEGFAREISERPHPSAIAARSFTHNSESKNATPRLAPPVDGTT